MKRVFLDANIYFAAAGSPNGGSALILSLAKKDKIKTVTVYHALAEAERNIGNKLGSEYLLNHYKNILSSQPDIQSLDSLTLEIVIFSLVPISPRANSKTSLF